MEHLLNESGYNSKETSGERHRSDWLDRQVGATCEVTWHLYSHGNEILATHTVCVCVCVYVCVGYLYSKFL